jgi:hypothetical protein
MAFRLKSDESVRRGLRRLARKEIRSAADALRKDRNKDAAIHDARSSLKKARAILRIFGNDNGRGLGKHWRRLRKASRSLSGLRCRCARRGLRRFASSRAVIVLCDRLFRDRALAAVCGELGGFRHAADRYQHELRRKALRRAKHVYTAPLARYVDQTEAVVEGLASHLILIDRAGRSE